MLEHGECLEIEADAADHGQRLDTWLASKIGHYSRTRIQDLIREGWVLAGETPASKPRDAVIAGLTYTITQPAPEPTDIKGQNIPLAVLFEDHDIIVINKPSGLVVHPAPGHADGTLVNALLYHCEDLQGVGGDLRPGIVHRLDKDTSGVMVVAKHQSALDALASQFQDRLTHKVYVAVVVGTPHPTVGRIETEIGRSRHDRKKMSTDTTCGRHAISNYKVIEVIDPFSVVQLEIETGRTHQIRVQMAHIGHPVAGDLVYGGSRSRIWKDRGGCPRQMLHSQSLSFTHPTTHQHVEFSAPLPDDMVSFISNAGKQN